jgi:hypothetical protein
MLDMEDNLYKNKYAVRAAIGAIKTLKKLDAIKEVIAKPINGIIL